MRCAEFAHAAHISTGSQKHLRSARNAFALITSLRKRYHSFKVPCGSNAHCKLTRHLLQAIASKYEDATGPVPMARFRAARLLDRSDPMQLIEHSQPPVSLAFERFPVMYRTTDLASHLSGSAALAGL
jgi:hypothetical protein